MTLNDLEPPPQKKGFLVNFSQFLDAAHISTLNCDEMAGDRPRQPAYDIFSIERTFLRIQGVFHTEASNLSTLSRRINILLLFTDCRGGRTVAVAR